MTPQKLFALMVVGLFAAGCALPDAVRRSSELLRRGWDVDSNGAKVMLTGPLSTLHAAAELAAYSVVPPRGPVGEPEVKWFHFYESPMRATDEIAILCHLDPATHIVTIRDVAHPIAVDARHELWHYPELEQLSSRLRFTYQKLLLL